MSFGWQHETLGPMQQKIKLLPKPRTDDELAVLTELCFGLPSGLSRLLCGSYESDTKFSKMFSKEFLSYHGVSTGSCRLYDYAGWFWNHVCGPLSCGGIAGRSYGQFKWTGYRHKKRIQFWEHDRRKNQGRPLREPFIRLARQLRDGKNREIRGIPVLTSSRVDGVEAA